VIAGLGRASGADLLDATVSPGGTLEALAVRVDGRTELWLANRTAEPVMADLGAVGAARVVMLDADGFERLTADPAYLETGARDLSGPAVTLDAYAVARISFA
jgi:hypothetical protein